jgi:hypothetical protein
MGPWIALLAALLLVAGCTSAGGPASAAPDRSLGVSPPASAKPSLQPNPDPNASMTPAVIDLPASIVDPIVDEIAGLAGIPRTEVVVVVAQAVTFPNGGLGCPKPGFMYTQVQVDGYRIVAKAGGGTYDYRGTGPGVFRRCT